MAGSDLSFEDSALSKVAVAPLLPLELWFPARGADNQVPPRLYGWLTEPGLLTERIERRTGQPVHVHVLDERVGFLTSEQQAVLGARLDSCFVRRIALVSQGRAYIYAETLVPDHTLELNPWLAELGERSLGTALAEYGDVIRGPLEFAALPASHPLAARALELVDLPTDTIWVRRSWFGVGGMRLLVQEAFLPSVSERV
jgi:chorismate lyase